MSELPRDLDMPLYNPFHDWIYQDPSTLPRAHVESINVPVLQFCKQRLAQLEQTGHNIAITVSGGAGSGKTHFIGNWFRDISSHNNDVIFCYSHLNGSAQQLWRCLRRVFLDALCRQDKSGLRPLDRILKKRLTPNGNAMWNENIISFLQDIFQKTKTKDDYVNVLDGLIREHHLCLETRTILPLLYDDCAIVRRKAEDWLRGEQLPENELEAMRLPEDRGDLLQQENKSKELIEDLCKLAGPDFRIVFCFDQIEGLQVNLSDDASLRSFAHLVDGLHSITGSKILILSFVLSSRLHRLEQAVGQALWDRMAMNLRSLAPLTWPQCEEIALSRLQTLTLEGDCAIKRESNRWWPFSKQQLEGLYQSVSNQDKELTPRKWIQHCAKEFESWQNGGPVIRDSVDILFERGFLERLSSWKPRGDKFASTFTKGLPLLVETLQLSGIEHRMDAADVDLCLEREICVGVALCNDTPSSLWRRFDRLCQQIEEYDKLYLLREEEDGDLTPGCQSRLKVLEDQGAHWLKVGLQPYRELAVLVELYTEAQNGKLMMDGNLFEPELIQELARSNEGLWRAASEFVRPILESLAIAQLQYA